jgi:hypothetical protein
MSYLLGLVQDSLTLIIQVPQQFSRLRPGEILCPGRRFHLEQLIMPQERDWTEHESLWSWLVALHTSIEYLVVG